MSSPSSSESAGVQPYKLYVLALENGCYYVGKSRDVPARVAAHRAEPSAAAAYTGAEWTSLHPPTNAPPLVLPLGGPLAEDFMVLSLMLEHGIDSVRGGCFAQPVLDSRHLHTLRCLMASAHDACFVCLEPGHYTRDCPRPAAAPAVAARGARARPARATGARCARCDRNSHNEDSCFARSRLDGTPLPGGGRRRPQSRSAPALSGGGADSDGAADSDDDGAADTIAALAL